MPNLLTYKCGSCGAPANPSMIQCEYCRGYFVNRDTPITTEEIERGSITLETAIKSSEKRLENMNEFRDQLTQPVPTWLGELLRAHKKHSNVY